ncbi:MAG: 16S rRNA processing protein RimM [Chloroflexaceae bacterium]|nr:16S rRNA processing protein RimM [Chloroflexaceae bacterium]
MTENTQQTTGVAPDALLLIGYIIGAFGVRGQVKLKAITDQPDHLKHQVRTIYIGAVGAVGAGPRSTGPYGPLPSAPVACRLLEVSMHKPGLLILTLQGVNTRDEAETLRRAEVFIHEDDAVPLEADEYYLHQLYHLRVETTDGVEVGRVREVLQTGAHEVLVIARPGQPDALIPLIREVVTLLDIPGGRVVVQVMEGLL